VPLATPEHSVGEEAFQEMAFYHPQQAAEEVP